MYCIAGFGKVKSASEFSKISNHNNRIHLTVKEKNRIDCDRTYLNKILVNPFGISKTSAPDLNNKIQEFYKKNEIEVRKNSVLAIDLMLTTSPEYFGEWHKNKKITQDGQKKIDEWVSIQMDFVKNQFGENAIKYAVLHLDETTPHIHFLVTPEQTKEIKFKNKYGVGSKMKTSLNADRWNPNFWKKFLTSYEKFNRKLGLKKGEEGSMSENVSLKDFMKMVEQASNTDYQKAIEKIVSDIKDDLHLVNTKAGIENLLLTKLLPQLNPLMKQNKALRKVLQQDRAKEYSLIKKMKADLEKEIESAVSRKDLYIEAINEKLHTTKLLKEQQDEINLLTLENKKLKSKYEPESANVIMNNKNDKGGRNGIHI